jgi:hypothetical protein
MKSRLVSFIAWFRFLLVELKRKVASTVGEHEVPNPQSIRHIFGESIATADGGRKHYVHHQQLAPAH